MNYYISDLHLFHKNITGEGKNYDNRPFATVDEMHHVFKEKWNNKISDVDHVYILGDISLRKKSEDLIAFVKTLKGNKHLILGNHDNTSDLRYRELFQEVCDYKEITDIVENKTIQLVLCHYPILMWKSQHRGAVLLYGHVHNSIENAFFQKCLKQMNEGDFLIQREKDAPIKAYNVGCMMPYMDYAPQTLEEIINSCT